MKKRIIWTIVAVVVILIGWFAYENIQSSSTTATSTPTQTEVESATNLPNIGSPATSDDIVVLNPASGNTVNSPITLSGQARGNWFFEATAPVVVIDTSGTILGRGIIRAQGNWMTTDLVPFSGTVSYSATPDSTAGAIVFLNDNPSGQASTSKYMIVPVYFTQ